MKTLPLVKLSICPCGFTVLHDHIQLGTEYRVDPASLKAGFTYGCGRCRAVHRNITYIKASCETNPAAELEYLPAELFGIKEPVQ